MKYLTSLILFISINLYSQTLKTNEIKIEYNNGYEIFNVYEINPEIDFNENLEYFWYNEYSGLKSTKGGTGGKLLIGNYKLFNENGNLIKDQNFKNGLKHGKFTNWDENGEIIEKFEYDDGILTYCKYNEQNEDGTEIIVEQIGKLFTIGCKRKTYLKHGGLIWEEELLNDTLIIHLIHEYYPYSNKFKAKYKTSDLARKRYYGDYFEFYENGNNKVTGEFAKSDLGSFMVGNWLYYTESGEIENSYTFKLHKEFYDDGKIKLIGSLIESGNNFKIYQKHWKWIEFYENGQIKDQYNYEWGELIENE